MKIATTAAALLLVAGGAGGYMFFTCPGRCGARSEPAVQPTAATTVAAPVVATPAAAEGCPVTPDCAGPECEPAAKPAQAAKTDDCCPVPPEGCCPDEAAKLAAPLKIEK
jgi:hypothetical protein